MGLMAALYMYAGYWIYKEKFLANRRFVHAAIPVMVPVVILSALANGTSFAISGNNMGNNFIFGLIISLVAAYLYIRLGVSMNNSFMRKVKIFGQIGRNSYHIFFAHALEYMIIPWDKLAEMLPCNVILKIILIFVTRCAVIAGISAGFIALSELKVRRKI